MLVGRLKTHHTQSTTPIDPKIIEQKVRKKDKVLYLLGVMGLGKSNISPN